MFLFYGVSDVKDLLATDPKDVINMTAETADLDFVDLNTYRAPSDAAIDVKYFSGGEKCLYRRNFKAGF